MTLFSKVFKHRDAASAIAKKHAAIVESTPAPPVYKPRYVTNWESTEVDISEVEDLIHACTAEMKSRASALDTPFLLLPFRPDTDTGSARTFIQNFFKSHQDNSAAYRGESLRRELRLTESHDLCCIIKWLWSRIPQGVVSWNTYASFRNGEQESGMVIDSFDQFIPISVDCDSRKNIIYDFFDLISVVAAHAKANGMGGRKLSRMAGWWAFEQSDTGKGFVGGYKSWTDAADAASHLFFAYLRSRAPEAVKGIAGISNLPRSLQALVSQTEYPPQRPAALQSSTSKVLMVVDTVSPTPFDLLRRARHFSYHADDLALNTFVEYNDPVDALTEECRRVLEAIASTNQSPTARNKRAVITNARLPSTFSLNTPGDDTWSRFQDEGFASAPVDSAAQSPQAPSPTMTKQDKPVWGQAGLQSRAVSQPNFGNRPTTPSWADFLNSGFAEDGRSGTQGPFLPPDQQLPPVVDRNSLASSQDDDDLEPGELASINRFDLDESFWWVWMTSLAAEETSVRKAAFGRCTLVETSIAGGRWLLLEEQVKGAAQHQTEGAYIAEKKSRSLFSRRKKSTKKDARNAAPPETPKVGSDPDAIGSAKANLSPDQKAKISAAAAAIARQNKAASDNKAPTRRKSDASMRTSIMALGFTAADVSPALKWANAYDKEAIRKKYLGDNDASNGLSVSPAEPQPPAVPAKDFTPTASVEIASAAPSAPSAPSVSSSPPRQAPESPVSMKKQQTAFELRRAEAERQLTRSRSNTPPSTSLGAESAPSQSGSGFFTNPPAAERDVEQQASAGAPALLVVTQSSTSLSSLAKRDSVSRKPLTAEAEKHIHPAYRNSMVDLRAQAAATDAATLAEAQGPMPPQKLQTSQSGIVGTKKFVVRRKDAPRSVPYESADSLRTSSSGLSLDTTDIAAHNVQPRRPAQPRSAVRDMIKNLEIVNTPSPDRLSRSGSATPDRARRDNTPSREWQDKRRSVAETISEVESSPASRYTTDEPELDAVARFARAKAELFQHTAPTAMPSVPPPEPRGFEEGDTSEEESIDIRMARIRARVAKLTGNAAEMA